MVDIYTMSVIVFFAIVAVLIYKDRRNVEFKYVIFIRRTKRFRDMIDRIAGLSPRFWKMFATVGVVTCFIVMAFGLLQLFALTNQIITRAITEPALQLILPSPSATGSSGPGFILIPFWFWVIVLAIILVPHEFSHGIMARAEKIRLKSVGLMLLAVLPGAFVEPDEKQLQKSRASTQLRVFAAGSFANFIVAALTILLISSLVWPGYIDSGIQLTSVNESSPAAMAGLQAGMVISHIDGKEVVPTYFEYLDGEGYLSDEVSGIAPGDTISLTVGGEDREVTLSENQETGEVYMGIIYSPIAKGNHEFFFSTLLPLLNLIWLLSFAVGMVNILPLYPLDGGRMMKAITDKYLARNSKHVVRIVSLLVLLIIMFDFLGPSLLNL